MKRLCLPLAAILVPLLVTEVSAQGCRRPNGIGSRSASRGINAYAPSRAITNPCSSMYRFGARSGPRIKRLYPGAVVRH